jgi:hypothetical protein
VQTAVVQGRRLTTFDRLEAVAKDDPSITAYGRRTMRLSLPSLSSLADAQYIADFELRRRKDPKGRISALMVTSHGQRGGAHHDKQLGLTMGGRIVVTEAQTGHSANYIIVGEMHHLRQGATLYQYQRMKKTPTSVDKHDSCGHCTYRCTILQCPRNQYIV